MGTPIPFMSTLLLVALSIAADIISIVPFVNFISALGMSIILWLYFKKKKVKKGFSIAMQIGEFIPLVSALPLTTLGVIVTIVRHNRHLKTHAA